MRISSWPVSRQSPAQGWRDNLPPAVFCDANVSISVLPVLNCIAVAGLTSELGTIAQGFPGIHKKCVSSTYSCLVDGAAFDPCSRSPGGKDRPVAPMRLCGPSSLHILGKARSELLGYGQCSSSWYLTEHKATRFGPPGTWLLPFTPVGQAEKLWVCTGVGKDCGCSAGEEWCRVATLPFGAHCGSGELWVLTKSQVLL